MKQCATQVTRKETLSPKVDLWVRKYNFQSHIHLHDCSCRISRKTYEFSETFLNYLEAEKVWEQRNELGAIIYPCLLTSDLSTSVKEKKKTTTKAHVQSLKSKIYEMAQGLNRHPMRKGILAATLLVADFALSYLLDDSVNSHLLVDVILGIVVTLVIQNGFALETL